MATRAQKDSAASEAKATRVRMLPLNRDEIHKMLVALKEAAHDVEGVLNTMDGESFTGALDVDGADMGRKAAEAATKWVSAIRTAYKLHKIGRRPSKP